MVFILLENLASLPPCCWGWDGELSAFSLHSLGFACHQQPPYPSLEQLNLFMSSSPGRISHARVKLSCSSAPCPWRLINGCTSWSWGPWGDAAWQVGPVRWRPSSWAGAIQLPLSLSITVLSSGDLLGFSEAAEKCNCGGRGRAAQRQSTRIWPGRSWD